MEPHRILIASLFALSLALPGPAVLGQEANTLPPPTNIVAADYPSDDGSAIYLTWDGMPYDKMEGLEYIVERESKAGTFEKIGSLPTATGWMNEVDLPFWVWEKNPQRHFLKLDAPLIPLPPKPADLPSAAEEKAADDAAEKPAEPAAKPDRGTPYSYRVRVARGEELGRPSEPVSVAAVSNLFATERLMNLLWLVLFGGLLFLMLEVAKRRDLFLRQIPGLSAVEEALGRATEMGKPVMYMTGRLDMDNIATIAATIILGEVAKKTAQYDVTLKVPHTYAVTMAVSREVTRNAYLEAGRLDLYDEEINYYITEEQFSYAAAVNGQMLRERPGAIFYMGYYYAESLLMAEAGASIGAIQIAGTNSESQLPFFVTTCDYTLLGEELFAASAYLSRKPELIGTLRAQDVAKLAIMVCLVLGTMIMTTGVLSGYPTGWITDLVRAF